MKPAHIIIATLTLSFSQSCIAEIEADPDQADERLETSSEELASYIWEHVSSGGTSTTTDCSHITVGSACSIPGATCTYLSHNLPYGPYHVKKVCREVKGSYRTTESGKNVGFDCPTNYTICPSSNPTGLPCSQTTSWCMWSCTDFGSSTLATLADCRP